MVGKSFVNGDRVRLTRIYAGTPAGEVGTVVGRYEHSNTFIVRFEQETIKVVEDALEPVYASEEPLRRDPAG